MNRSANRTALTWLLILTTAWGPVGCGSDDGQSVLDKASVAAASAWSVTRDSTTGAWKFVSKTGAATWTVMSDKAKAGGEAAWDASKSAMLWSRDRSLDGWEWISTNVVSATEWAADTTKQAWLVTQEKTGDFYLWVKVEAAEGVAYVRTAVPAAWKVTKDAAGKAWIWIGEHQLQAATAATVIALVVTGLMLEPVTTSTLLAKGAVTRAGAEFLTTIYKTNRSELGDMTEEEFVEIGSEVLKQNGENAEQAAQGPAE